MAPAEAAAAVVQLRRRVNAGAAEIFELWTRPELMARWMSPFSGTVDCKATADLRPGGAFSLVMVSGEARREVSGTYVLIERPHKLVFTWSGALTNHVQTLVTLELSPSGNETDLVLTHERLPTQAMHEGHTRGWGIILDHLAEALQR